MVTRRSQSLIVLFVIMTTVQTKIYGRSVRLKESERIWLKLWNHKVKHEFTHPDLDQVESYGIACQARRYQLDTLGAPPTRAFFIHVVSAIKGMHPLISQIG